MKKILYLLSIILITACKTSTKTEKDLPDATGKMNTLSIIIDNKLWEGTIGDELRTHFAAPVDGLPMQEPLFSIHQIVPEAFTDFARNGRNILIVEKKTKTKMTIKDNVFAKSQKIAYISATADEELINQIKKSSEKIIATFKAHEIQENQRRFESSLNNETFLQEKLGISLKMPSIYKTAKQEDDFLWIERKIQKGTMNIIAYELPLNSIPNDSTQTIAIIKMRDSIGQKYIPGREEGMHMITEKAYSPYIYETEIANKPAIETRGMWEMKNFFMAGPFLNYIIEDKSNNRLLVLEGFVFAPSVEKRNYMFELEAILKSVKIEAN